MPEQKIEDILALYGERVNHEHVVIANRMSWLMTLNGFLIAGLGVTIANAHNIPHASSALILVGIACLGAVSNASCLFSNYWGSRAISEMVIALHEILNSPEYRGDLSRSWNSLRLYGRDPDNPPLPSSFWRPPTKFLHPWHLLPIIFGVAYLLVPISGLNGALSNRPGIGTPQPSTVLLALIPIALTAILLIPPILIERRWRNTVRNQRKADLSWTGTLPDRNEYNNEILPNIGRLSRKQIVGLLECSPGEAKAILNGDFIPHERHWDKLKSAMEASR